MSIPSKTSGCLARLQSALSGKPKFIAAQGSWPESWHHFDESASLALRTAVAAGRPLLIRGEPGIGKSQIARVVAEVMEVPFLPFVVNSTCECNDLLFTYDAVSRLAQAQLTGAGGVKPRSWKRDLAERRFVRPQVLWWAIHWEDAAKQRDQYYDPSQILVPHRPAGWEPGSGAVVLIDEIDKADSDLPNGLLESLSNTGFQLPQGGVGVALPKGHLPPLIVITTNEERELPAAFLRRCVILNLSFPEKRPEQEDFLVQRGRAHFQADISTEVLEAAARQILGDREEVPIGQPRPGAAEYLDLLRALKELASEIPAQLELLDKIAPFVVRKHLPDLAR